MPEIAGDAALLVDPKSVEQIAGAMERIGTQPSLKAQLREKGIARARKYPWQATCNAVRQVLGGSVSNS
jgi:glycosyltransferase involved in cell wall biosynthesis